MYQLLKDGYYVGDWVGGIDVGLKMFWRLFPSVAKEAFRHIIQKVKVVVQ